MLDISRPQRLPRGQNGRPRERGDEDRCLTFCTLLQNFTPAWHVKIFEKNDDENHYDLPLFKREGLQPPRTVAVKLSLTHAKSMISMMTVLSLAKAAHVQVYHSVTSHKYFFTCSYLRPHRSNPAERNPPWPICNPLHCCCSTTYTVCSGVCHSWGTSGRAHPSGWRVDVSSCVERKRQTGNIPQRCLLWN